MTDDIASPPLQVPAGLLERSRSRVAGRVAIVTGAGESGDEPMTSIGHAIAVLLAAAGARVAVLDVDSAAAQKTVGRIRALGLEAEAFITDVRSRDQVDAAVAAVVRQYGGLHIVVNNVAILGDAATLDSSDEDFLHTLDINVMGTIRTSRAALPYLTRGSAITHISSLGAIRSFGKLDYEASKGAINSMVNTMAIEYGPRGIRVNAVSPGQVWTPMGRRRLVNMGRTEDEIAAHRQERALGVPLRQEGTSWDIAAAALFLSSDDAAWVTGQVLAVDGGQSGVVGYMPQAI
jgi:NAD(P)-dependent dehydrogenase (short-subunit alcohol dehydrogenase family)